MGKRFTHTEKWDDPWYMDLPIEMKLLWNYINDKCDSVGVWKPNIRLACFQIGIESKPLETLLKAFGNRINILENGDWWIVNFCRDQYPELDPESKSPPIQSYIKKLKSYNLYKGYLKGFQTLKEKDKEKEGDKELKGGVGENKGSKPKKRFVPPTLEEMTEYFKSKSHSEGFPIHRAEELAKGCYNHHIARDWILTNGKKASRWKALCNTWILNDKKFNPEPQVHQTGRRHFGIDE